MSVRNLVVSHPTGNANSRQAFAAFVEAGLAVQCHTSIALFEGGLLDRLSNMPGLGEIRRRAFPKALQGLTRMHPWREIVRLFALRIGITTLTESERGWACVDRVYHEIDKATARSIQSQPAAGAYCYEDGALFTFRAAKRTGAKCFYDLPIGYWRSARQILSEEAERRPEWASTIQGLRDSHEKLERKDAELRLAERIVVASSFTARTLKDCPFPVAPVSVIPYGADDPSADRTPVRRGGPLRILFVGSLSQRKGIADVFESVGAMGRHAELTVIGSKAVSACNPLDEALRRCRWIPSLPRERILEEMRGHDVLLFPSLFEGFGLVVTEALSQGLPIITTPHTCGPDVLTEGEDGFIVPIRDPLAITAKLELLHRDRELLATMSEAARKKAEGLKWADYRRRIVEVVSGT